MEMVLHRLTLKAKKQKQWACIHDQRINKNIATTSV